MNDDRPRKRMTLEQSIECLEGERGVVRSPVEPLAPDAAYPVVETLQGTRVPGDAVVPVVSSELLYEHCALRRERDVTIVAAPLGRATECASEPSLGCLAGDDPRLLPRL